MRNELQNQTPVSYSAVETLSAMQSQEEIQQVRSAKRPFLNYIHNFRAIAILLIVAIHCYSILTPGAEPILIRRGTLLFMFISGFLFHYLSDRFEKKAYWKKKLKYVIRPYLVISTPIILARVAASSHSSDMLSLFPGFEQLPVFLQVPLYYITGLHLVPLWFIPMLCFYYILAPVFVALDKDGKIYYLLPLLLCLSLLVTRATEVYKMHLAFIHYLSVYLLGMFVSKNRDKALQATDNLWAVLAAAVAAVACVSLLFKQKEIPFFEQFLFLQKLILCWGLIYGLWKFDKYVPKQLSKFSDMSFGIFFVHYYLLFLLTTASYKGYIHLTTSFLSFFLIFVADLAFSISVLFLIKKAFGDRSRSLIGY